MQPVSPLMTEVRRVWLKAIKAGEQAKDVYRKEADACEKFYCGDQSDIYSDDFAKSIGLVADDRKGPSGLDGNAPRVPTFRIRDNAAGKLVQIFTPFLLSGEVVPTVKPLKPFLPPPIAFGLVGDANTPSPVPPRDAGQMALLQWAENEQRRMFYQQAAQQAEMEWVTRQSNAGLIEHVLTYTVKESNLKGEARLSVRDALVRGLGALQCERIPLPNGTGSLIADTYLDDNCVVVDPDAKRLKDAQWVAIRCEHPTWQAAQNYAAYGVTENDLRPGAASATALSVLDHHRGAYDKKNVFVYWKVYSRCGVGARLMPEKDRPQVLRDADSVLGDYAYIVVADGCDFPLNLGPKVEQMAYQSGGVQPFQVATSWPVPFYFDPDDPFPFTSLWFHSRKDSPWPVAHTSFAIGYLNFGAWILGYIADKAYRSARGAWIVDASLAKKVAAWLRDGQDEEIFEVTKGVDKDKVGDFIEFLEGAKLDLTLTDIARYFEEKARDMTGVNDVLMANVDRQMRSAQEADVLDRSSRLRPDDMSATMQQFLARVIRKRAIALRYLFSGQDLIQIIGQYGAMAWDQSIKTKDVAELFREATYGVETGRGRPLDIQADLENINQAMQFLFPALMQYYQQTGDPSQVNALILAWCKARQMDATGLLFPPMMPPEMVAAQQQDERDQRDKAQDQAHEKELADKQAKQRKAA
jgi:hypothetical protein